MKIIYDTDLAKMDSITYIPPAKQVYFNDTKMYSVDFYDGDQIREDEDLIFAIKYENVIFDEQFLREFDNQISWRSVIEEQTLTIDFIREYKDSSDDNFWYWVSEYVELTEKLIDEFRDYLDWTVISHSQTLSEDFIKKYIDYVDWNVISAKQKISEDFARKYKDYLNWEYVIRQNKFSESFLLEVRDYIDEKKAWEQLSLWQELSDEFMKKNGINPSYKYLFQNQKDMYYNDAVYYRRNPPKLIK